MTTASLHLLLPHPVISCSFFKLVVGGSSPGHLQGLCWHMPLSLVAHAMVPPMTTLMSEVCEAVPLRTTSAVVTVTASSFPRGRGKVFGVLFSWSCTVAMIRMPNACLHSDSVLRLLEQPTSVGTQWIFTACFSSQAMMANDAAHC